MSKKFDEIIKKIGLGTKEEALAQAIAELSDEEKIKMFSQIQPFEDEALATLLVISERYGLAWLKKQILEKLQLRVSLMRQGRAEYVKMIVGEKKGKITFPFFGKKEEREKF